MEASGLLRKLSGYFFGNLFVFSISNRHLTFFILVIVSIFEDVNGTPNGNSFSNCTIIKYLLNDDVYVYVYVIVIA